MGNKSKFTGGLLLFLVIAFAVASTAEARHFGRGHGMPFPGRGLTGLKTLIALDLSEEQESKMMEIIEKYEDQSGREREGLFEARRNLFDALESEPLDEIAIRNAFQQMSQIRENLLVMRAKMMNELKTVLNSDQIERLQERKSQRMERLKNRFENWDSTRTD
jgi:Spy/CpxP family protein refolding chaperone